MSDLQWRRASQCSNATCVEVAVTAEAVLVRDSKHRERQPQCYSHEEWTEFLLGVRAGEFDLKTD